MIRSLWLSQIPEYQRTTPTYDVGSDAVDPVTGTVSSPTPGTAPAPTGTAPAPTSLFGSGETADYFSALYRAVPAFARQTADLLQTLGPEVRAAVLNASPELAQASSHLLNLFQDPYGGAMQTFQEAIRGAQAARGFTGGGTGPVGEEARYLTNYAMQRRDAAVPQLMQLGQGLISAGGLWGGQNLGFESLGDTMLGYARLAEQQRQYDLGYKAEQGAAKTAQEMYEQQLADLQAQARTSYMEQLRQRDEEARLAWAQHGGTANWTRDFRVWGQ